jgi:Tc toxin complex TcA C-terminal TcB-binding domain/Concanavalin A-like lectin/glucanases superfamily/Neuraminidase-like domain/Salmonella virulence plasmid 28.1kDa A protein
MCLRSFAIDSKLIANFYKTPFAENTMQLNMEIQERLQKISPNAAVAARLQQLGYHSAHQIAMGRASEFLAKAGPQLEGLVAGKSGRRVAKTVYDTAHQMRNRVWSLALAPLPAQASADLSHKLQQPDFQEGLPNYERLFGPMLSCDCKDCMSIYSPGAYFVDLMNVVGEYIVAPSAGNVPAWFALQFRRPDLWTLSIDCQNANTEVGYLEIVNAVMLQNLSTNFLQDIAPIAYLASANYPFAAPYNQPLEQTRAALSQLGAPLPSIYKSLNLSQNDIAQALLKLSPEQNTLITEASTAMPALTTLYGFHDPSADVTADLSVQALFLERTEMTPPQLEAMVYQDLHIGTTTTGPCVQLQNWGGTLYTTNANNAAFADSITIELWVFPNSFAHTTCPIAKSKTGEFSIFQDTTGHVYFYFGASATTCNSGTMLSIPLMEPLTLNAWNHIAFVRDNAGRSGCAYRNGRLTWQGAITNYATPAQTTCTLYLGYGFGDSSYFGSLSEVRIWSTMRSHDEIVGNMRSRIDPDSPDLLCYWPLNEDTGNVAHDLGPNAYNATFGVASGSPGWTSMALPFSDSELVPGLVDTLFINQVLGNESYLALQGQDLAQKQVAQIGVSNGTTLGPLTTTALYQIAPMKRLQQQTGWAWPDLDWALKSVAGTSQTITTSMISQLGQVAGLLQAYDIALDEACAFWYDMKTYGRGDGVLPQDLWDRVWNAPPLFAHDESTGQPPYYRPIYALNPLFSSPVINVPVNGGTTENTMVLAHMANALSIPRNGLDLLLGELSSHVLALDTATSIALTVPNMSILYRYARLATMLGLAIKDLLQLLDLLVLKKAIWTVANVVVICEAAAWLRQENMTVGQLGFLMQGKLPEDARPILSAQQLQQAIDTVRHASAQVRVTADSFVTTDITKSMAETIYTQLTTDGFIDTAGLVLHDVALTSDNVYGSLITGVKSAETLFAADPSRQIAQLANTGSSSSGTIQLGYDPFADATIQQDNNFTISFWMNSAQVLTPTWPGFVGWDQGASNNNKSPCVTQVQSKRGAIVFEYSPQAGGQRVAAWLDNFIHEDNEWIFVTWVVQDGAWQIYRNGELFPGVDVVMATPPYVQQAGLSGYPVGYEIGNILTGAVANVAIWNIALDVRTIREIMFAAPAAGTAGLLGYWPIDEGSGTQIHDCSGNATLHNGTLQGSYAWQQIGHLPARKNSDFVLRTLQDALQAQSTLVYNGLAARLGVSAEVMAAVCDLTGNEVPQYSYPAFDGEANYVQIPYNAALNNTAFTLALFVMPTGNPDTERILLSSLDYAVANVTKGYQLNLNAQNQVIFTMGSGGSEYNVLTAEISIRAQVWTSVVATYDGSSMKLAINGLNFYENATTAFAPNATESLYIAAGLNGEEAVSGFFKGHIVQVMVGNVAASKHTIILGYDKLMEGKTVSAPNLQGWWKLNQQPLGSTVIDASGKNNNGTLEGDLVYTPYPANELLRLQTDSDATPTATLPAEVLQWLNGNNPQRQPYLRKLVENVQLAKVFRLTAAEFLALQTQTATFGTADLGFTNNNFSLAQLKTLSAFKAMVRAFGDTSNQLLAYFRLALDNQGADADTDVQLQALLARITGWSQQDLANAMTYFDLQQVTTVAQLWELSEVMAIASKTGIGIDGLQLIAKLPALNLVTPASGTDPWQTYLSVAQVTQGALRAQGKGADQTVTAETQASLRDRLATWLIWELNANMRGVKNQQDLYEYLLIDVMMSPDVKTSYLVSAMNSLQLYVNRCYNNLEPGVINEVPSSWWEWMSTYRVWQANREVYLYPENYVDPSLRKFASPQFKTLLNDISKGQVTADTVTQALAKYVDGIMPVANLFLVDAYTKQLTGRQIGGSSSDDSLYTAYLIAGRSHTTPAQYYARMAIATSTAGEADSDNMHFGPWEPLPGNIASDYVTMAFAFGKQFAFWVEQTSRTSNTSTNINDTSNAQYHAYYATIKYVHRQLNGAWTAPITLRSEILIGVYGIDGLIQNYFPQSLEGFRGLSELTDGIPYVSTRAWNKVEVVSYHADHAGTEQLLITLGDIVHCSPTKTIPPSPVDTSSMQGPVKAWQTRLNNAATFAYSMKPQKTTVVPALLLDAQMQVQEIHVAINDTASKSIGAGTIMYAGLQTLTFEIASSLFNQPLEQGSPAFASYWPMVYGHSSVTNLAMAEDVVAGRNGQLTNTFQLHTSSCPGSSTAYALQFGASNYNSMTINNHAYQQLSEFTYAFWINFNYASTWSCSIIDMLQNAGQISGSSNYYYNGWQLATQVVSNAVQFLYTFSKDANGTLGSQLTTNANLLGNTWYYVVLAFYDGIPTIYLNGVALTWNAAPTQINHAHTVHDPKIVIGHNAWGAVTAALNAAMFDLKYWTVCLDAHAVTVESAPLSYAYLNGTSDLKINRIGNSTQSFIANLGQQAYLCFAQDQLPMMDSSAQATSSPDHQVLYLTTIAPPTAPATNTTVKFVRINTAVLPQLSDALQSGGFDGLLSLPSQYLPEQGISSLIVSDLVVPPAELTMDFEGAFGLYFWELFFYAPYLIAEKLRHNQQFAAAQRWYKYVFDPTAPQSVQALWPMAALASSGIVHDFAGAHAGTAYNVTLAAEAEFPFSLRKRAAYIFDGTTSYVQVPTSEVSTTTPYYPALNPATFTVAAWFFLTAPPSGTTPSTWQSIITSRNSGPETGYIVYVNYASSKYTLQFWTGKSSGFLALKDNTTLQMNTWYHVTATFDGEYMRLYINGIESTVGPFANSGFVSNTNRCLRIGTGCTEGNPNYYFRGQIAEVGIWDRPLTAGEINNLYVDYKYQRLTNRFWNFAPFRRLNAESLYHILRGDSYHSTYLQPAAQYTANLQMKVYEYDPFDPDAIARLRVNSYQKAVFMRFVQNQVAWGDSLFGQATWEALTDATMQYVLAADILGKIPVKEVTQVEPTPTSYQGMKDQYGDQAVPDFLIDMETDLPTDPTQISLPEQVQSLVNAYFCIPNNDQMLQLWKLVGDRLYKLRHGLSLAGQPLDIPLYAPPIDPAALVSARAAGVTLSSLGTLPGVPAYRFSYLIQQAKSLASETQQLGNALLAALEKQDAEQLAEMQQGYQIALNNMSLAIKADQINQLRATDQSLHISLQSATHMHDTYAKYIHQFLNAEEIIGLVSMTAALFPMAAAEGVRLGAGIAYLLPDIGGLAVGGMQFGDAVNMGASILEGASQLLNSYGQLANTMGQYLRRMDDWKLQESMAGYQMQEIKAQIQANHFALKAAHQEMELAKTQYAQSQAVLDFLRTKFTNVELYQWMAGQVSSLYFQTYQLAYNMAQMAQMAFQYELNSQQTFLNPAAWNSLYQGLLAGETLNLSLAQLESAYVSNNTRKLNVRKTYSLRQQNPLALLQLLSTGYCTFELGELLYDLDFPGHYNRKIKTLTVSIPAVVGPYQNIHATLVQTHNTLVTKPSVAAVEYLVGQSQDMPLDGSIRSNWNPNQEIVISTGVNDSGIFQVNLDDPQYLPFEGTGAVSGWALSIPQAANGFPLSSISDVILSVEYSSQDGGKTYKDALTRAITGLNTYAGLYYISLRQMFSGAWHNFLTSKQLPFEIVRQMFPQNLSGSITLGNSDGDIMLFPILSAAAASDALPPIMLNTNTWDASTYNVLAGAPPVQLSANGTSWTITLGTFAPGSPLLTQTGAIDPTAWLDIALVIPFSGALQW